MSEPRKPIIPPQKELEDEIRAHARAQPVASCARCGEPGQRFLRRCPKCGRRYRSSGSRAPSARRIPGNW